MRRAKTERNQGAKAESPDLSESVQLVLDRRSRTPYYQQIRDRLSDAIVRGVLRPGERLPSARSLASHRSRLIGLIYDDPSVYEVPSAGYIIKMQEGALRACRKLGYELLIHPARIRSRDVVAELRVLIEKARPDGIILAAPLSNMPKFVRAIGETGTPLVRLSPGGRNGKQYVVSTNDREISAEMTRYLASLGHRKIAFITGHPSHKAVGNRFLGYKDGLEQSGLKFSSQLVAAGDNSIGSGEDCALELLDRSHRPTAIFAANDDMAAGVIRVADRLDIEVPGELSIAGCDDIALAQQVYPALTTINQPLTEMAERAATVLIESRRNKDQPQGSEIVPASMKLRDSTGPAPA